MTASAGVSVTTQAKVNRTRTQNVWEVTTTFTTIDGDTTGAAAIPLNGLLQQITIEVPDMADGEDTLDVSLTDANDTTVWSVTNLTQGTDYAYSVYLPFSEEVNIILGHDDTNGAVVIVVTLRGI